MPESYASIANAAALSGLAESDINSTQKNSVDEFVELMLGRSFTSAQHTQYYDIEGSEKTLQLPHWPLISVTRFRDNQRETSYTDLVEDTDFTVDKQAGLVKLIQDDFNILKGSAYLTVGTKTVAITYNWGYSSIPNDVKLFADWMLAWIAEQKKVMGASKTTGGAVLKRVQMGDYSEAYGVGSTEVDKKYKETLSGMSSMLIGKYKFWGEDGDYFISF